MKTYTIMRKGSTPSDVKIQLEDWSAVYLGLCMPFVVAAYPVSPITIPNPNGSGWNLAKEGMALRLAFAFPYTTDAVRTFEDLQSGEKELFDLIENVSDPRYKRVLKAIWRHQELEAETE